MSWWAGSSSAPAMWHLHGKRGHVPWLAPKFPLCLDVWCCKPQHNTGDSDARHFLTHFFQNVSLNLCKCMHFAWEVLWKYFPFFFFFCPNTENAPNLHHHGAVLPPEGCFPRMPFSECSPLHHVQFAQALQVIPPSYCPSCIGST